ncbi:hypothetical protein Mal15_67490 [Stieleria maiorica]|uniref:Preprotein translocase subunit SecA n=1 Tax=Stieleria maiorica TaxID=2795974 RepID=A0A5B9MU97_9BACT|nr:DUF1186 domain-containing protein [Stieleria maiorica]QEG02628.1 hypothetical protein Mal15_67490 [Stieleria maiorica]
MTWYNRRTEVVPIQQDMTMEDPNTSAMPHSDLESILDHLDDPDVRFPADAIEEARKRSQEITPLLIRQIEDATHDCRLGKLDPCCGHFYGALLLAEFRAVEAWPAIRAAISLPGDLSYKLFGDAITEDFGCVIATLAGDQLSDIDDLVSDRSVDVYVRWAACDTALYRIRDEAWSREEAIEWLSRHLEKAIENKDELAEGLVTRLEDLAAEQKLPLIEAAFAAGVIDDELYSLDEVKETIAQGDAIFHETMEGLHFPSGLVSHVEGWLDGGDIESDWDVEFGPYDDEPLESFVPLGESEDDYVSRNGTTIRNEGVKVGRNDKCPCGSGQKYKKCCGRTSVRNN